MAAPTAPARRGRVVARWALAVGLGLLWIGGRPSSAKAQNGGVLAPRVDRAVRRGLDYLYKTQATGGYWKSKYSTQHGGGVAALVVWTALAAGEDPAAPALAAALKHLKSIAPQTVYVRAARALAYARLPGREYAGRLAVDVDWLAKNQHRLGGWGYGPGHRTTRESAGWTDISNTFLAMLALQRASDAGARAPSEVWSRCRAYWMQTANADGGLGYQPPQTTGFRLRGSSYGSMTAAGASAMMILSAQQAALQEALFSNSGARRENASPYAAPVGRALKWLAGNPSIDKNPKWVWGAGEAYEYYYLFALSLLADEIGVRRIGAGADALGPAVAKLLVSSQKPDGSWGDPQAADPAAKDDLAPIRTCFALQGLLAARRPIVLQKLVFGARAGHDPRDAANLTRWIGQALGWQGSWRQVGANATAQTLSQSPVLYIQAGAAKWPEGLGKEIRAFVGRGGTVLVQPFAAEKPLVEAAHAYFRGLFPDFWSQPILDSHPIYSARFMLPPGNRPRVLGLGDSCRARVLILADDVSGAWHQGRTDTHGHLFQLGANVVMYTTDLSKPAGQLRTGAARAKPAPTVKTVTVARIRHRGDWQLGEAAIGRVNDVLAGAVSLGIKEAEAVDLSEPVDDTIALLWLTGTRLGEITAAQRGHLKNYLAAGGTVLIDSAMGGKQFTQDAAVVLAEIYTPTGLREMPPDHPIITGRFAGGMGSDLTKVSYTRAAAAVAPPGEPPKLTVVSLDGRAAAILSPYAVTCPLLDQPTFGCKGLAAPDAARLAANVVLYAVTRRPAE